MMRMRSLFRYIWMPILYPTNAEEDQGREERLCAIKRFYERHCCPKSEKPQLLKPQLLYADAALALGLPEQ
jgi:hypothetical protein